MFFAAAWGQDPRGAITGTVTDPAGAVIAGAAVAIVNTETQTVIRTSTNETGYFEVGLLNPGVYSIAVEVPGFKRSVRTGLALSVAGRLNVPIQMEVGQVAESIEVTAQAPVIDTTTASGGRIIDNKQVTELPFTNMNPFALATLAAGMQWTGEPQSLRPFDRGGTSAFNTMGGIGGNEYTVDGAPVTGIDRTVGYIPPSEAVSEFKLETTPFDASYGHTTGAVVNVMTKAGTNSYRGSLFNQHWQQRWNATPHFTRLAFERDVREGRRRPSDQRQEPGRQNNFGATLGGPMWFPKLYNGKNKFFFMLSYNGVYQSQSETRQDVIYNTTPKAAWRQGDFSDLLAIDAVRFTVYDPRSARRDGARVVRTPFPGNRGVPVLNPVYKFYEQLYPLPNDVPGVTSREGFNNYYAGQTANISVFNSVINRYDYNLSDSKKLFARWLWNKRTADTRDWFYETRRGLGTVDLNRINHGAGGNYVWIISASHLLDASVNWYRFSEGNLTPGMVKIKPTDVGLPKYLDEKAGDQHTLPRVEFGGITSTGRVYGQIERRGATGDAKIQFTSIRGKHTIRYGYNERRYWYTQAGAGYTSGRFVFNNTYMRAADNTTTASNLGLDWAAFMMGLPSTITLDTNDSAYWSTRFRALFVQDEWRVRSRLRISAGLRYEREGGITERFNRGLGGGFLFGEKLPFSDLAAAAYASTPIPQLAASEFRPVGGVEYLGARKRTYTDGTHTFMPRLGVVYQLSDKTVLRGGYGWFYDTLNANNVRPNQYGFSQPTNTTVSSDLGLSFCCGVGSAAGLSSSKTPMHDPFPVRPDGGRFQEPYRNQLGASAFAGRSYSFIPRNFIPAWQQKWRLALQRQIQRDLAIEVSYNGSFALMPVDQRVDFLPSQYWATGNARNQAVDDTLNANVTNPFYIENFRALATSAPLLYQYMSTTGFFTSRTIRRHQLLRGYPHMTGLTGLRPDVDFKDARGGTKYHDMQVQLERRFAKGFQTAVLYTRAYSEEQDYYWNEFDPKPSWRPTDQVRPHRFVWTTIAELPLGKGRRWVSRHPVQHLVGGWQLSWIYQIQNGAPASWGNRFFYGDLSKIKDLFRHKEVHAADIHTWFDPSIAYRGAGPVPAGFTGFEGRSAMQPGSYHVRVFPTRLSELRNDGIRNWDVKILRRFKIAETWRATFSVDLLNATNHTNFGGLNTDPTSTNFGKVTTQVGQPRFIQLNLRIDF